MGKPSIATLPPFQMAIVAFVSILLLGGLWLYDEYEDVQASTESRAETYIIAKKELLKLIVQDSVAYIRHMQERSDDIARSRLMEQVGEAFAIAEAIYKERHQQDGPAHTERLIKRILLATFSNQGYGSLFVIDRQGRVILDEDFSEENPWGTLNRRDTGGKYLIDDALDLEPQWRGYSASSLGDTRCRGWTARKSQLCETVRATWVGYWCRRIRRRHCRTCSTGGANALERKVDR